MKTITMDHGSGGKLTHNLIKNMFFKHMGNDILDRCDDSAKLDMEKGKIAFTTDSFVIKPLFFPGGDIGKLAICGTVNDLAVSGAIPKYITCGFILEEGFSETELEKIVGSMGKWAKHANVKIVAGDTKVVEKHNADGIFINTSGIGIIDKNISLGIDKIKSGNKVIVSGTLGDHGISVLSKREGIKFDTTLESDCAPLNFMIREMLSYTNGVLFMRDPTRGGLATTLNEITAESGMGIIIEEKTIPVKEEVRSACELLGMDPLYIANEGKVIIISEAPAAERIVDLLKIHKLGQDAAVIGEVTSVNPGKVYLRTKYGGEYIMDMLTGEQLPRIC